MSISKYEAAAVYDYKNSGFTEAQQYLVIDLDDYTAGVCRCSSPLKTELRCQYHLAETGNMYADLINGLTKLCGDISENDVEQMINEQLGSANKIMNDYLLSERINDKTAFTFNQTELSCSAIENSLQKPQKKVKELCTYIKGGFTEDEMESMRIIVLGKAQEFRLCTYYLRESLSEDPFLEDSRFINPLLKHHWSEIVKIGIEYLKTAQTVPHEYSLVLFDAKTAETVRLKLADKNTNIQEIKKPKYIGPIYVSDEDGLQIETEAGNMNLKLPYSFRPIDSDLIDVALISEDSTMKLMIRRCRFPTKIYKVNLDTAA